MVFCRKCGTENNDNAKFCKNCGARIEQSPMQNNSRPEPPQTAGTVCPYCGQPVAPGVKFCKNCGAKIEQNAAQNSPGPQPSKAAGAVCPSCGKPIPAGAKFCKNCGAKIEQAPIQNSPGPQPPKATGTICPSCGKPVPRGVKFCRNCGARIEQNPTQNAPQGNKPHKPKNKKLILGIGAAVCSIALLFTFIGGSNPKSVPKREKDPMDDYFSDVFSADELDALFNNNAQAQSTGDGSVDYKAVLERLGIENVFSQTIVTADDLKGPPMTEEDRIQFIRESLASETDIDVSHAEVPLPPENLNQESRVYGSLEKDGVEVQIPAGAIDDNIQLEIVKTEDGGIDISAPGYEDGIMLWEPATIRMALSEPVDENQYLNHVGIYEGKNGTETFTPTVDGLNNQVLEIQTTHFSEFYPREHTNDECSEYFSEQFAGRHIDLDFALQTKKDHKKSIADVIAQGYKAIGIEDPELINYLAQQVAGELLQENMAYNVITGDHVTLADNASKAAVSTYLNYCVKFADDTTKNVAIGKSQYFAGNIGKYTMAAIKGGVIDGSINGALEETMKTFAMDIPAVKWGKMAADIAVISRNMLTRAQEEEVYKLYEKSRDQDNGVEHDSTFMDLLNGAYYRNYLSQCNIDAVQAYGGIPYNTFLQKYPDLAKKICANTQANIIKNLRNRYEHRNEKANLQHHYKAFIDSLFEYNLIKKGDLNRAFNNGRFYSAEEYLDRMLYARRVILNMLDGDINRFGDKTEKQEKNLSYLAYMFLHSGNAGDGRMEVLKYLYRNATGRLQLRKTDEVYEEAKQYAEEEEKQNRPSGENKEKSGYWKRTGRSQCCFTPESKTDYHQGSQGEHHSVHERYADCTPTSFKFHTYINGNWWVAGMYNYGGAYQDVAVTFSEPAQSYNPGETVCVNVGTSVSAGGPQYYHDAWARAYAVILSRSYEEIVEHNCGGAWPGAQDLSGKNGEKIEYDEKENNSLAFYGTMPEGRPGDKICIRYEVYVSSIGTGESAGSVFEYEWVEEEKPEEKPESGYWKHTGRQHFYFDPSDSDTAHQGKYTSLWKMDNSASATEFTCSGSVEGNYWSGGTGRDEDNYNGSTFYIHASFSEPKSSYAPGEQVAVAVQNTVNMTCKVPGEAVSLASDGTIISHTSYEEIVKHNCSGRWPSSRDLVRNDGKDIWADHTQSRNYTICGNMPEAGKPGDKICIRYNASAGPLGFSNQGFGSVWEYEWVEEEKPKEKSESGY